MHPPLALETPQLLLMTLSFVGMAASLGLGLWLLRRNKSRAERPPAAAVEVDAGCIADKTEFVAAPAPVEKTEFMPVPLPVETTEIVPVHLASAKRDAPSPADKTEIVPVHLPTAQRAAASPADEPEFVPVDRPVVVPDQAPAVDRTAFMPVVHATPVAARRPAPARDQHVVLPATARTNTADLDEHLSLAMDAFARLQHDASESTASELAGHFAVLAAAPVERLLERVRPRLHGAVDLRWSAALLSLLQHKTWTAKLGLPELFEQFDAERRDAALRALQSWDDPRAESLARSCLESANSAESRALWLRCFAERGWNPGIAMIEAALDDVDPRMIAAGLRLLPHAHNAEHLRSRLSSFRFASDPGVRTQAIETSLVLAEPGAELMCRQLARNPSFPGVAVLVGLLGNVAELANLALQQQDLHQAVLRGLGLSGRPVVLHVCVARFDDDDVAVRDAARDTLALAAGRRFAEASDAQAWLAEQPSATRLLAGRERNAAQVLEVLERGDEDMRMMLAREVWIRSGGRVWVAARLLPWAFARELARVRADIERLDFGL